MNETFFYVLGAILVMDGILMWTCTWAAESERFRKYRIRVPQTYRIPPFKRFINVMLNSILSLSLIAFALYYLGGFMIESHPLNLPLFLGEVLGSLMVYDFLYYFMHRGMHHPKAMKYCHGVHHYVRFPTSFESIYLHPAENIAGLALLFIGIMVMGPVAPASFLTIFFIHHSANILVHSNLIIPHPLFKLPNYWATKHDYHHHGHLNKNYASIFPFWDMMFGTYK